MKQFAHDEPAPRGKDWKRRGLLVVGLTIAACTESSAPFFSADLRTEVSPAIVTAGDTVVLRAIMSNPTSERLDVGGACGPPVFFEVNPSAGDPLYPVPLDLAFTCERNDFHDLEPGEVDTLTTRWRVPAAAGQYSVRSGFRTASGLERLTSSVALTVR